MPPAQIPLRPCRPARFGRWLVLLCTLLWATLPAAEEAVRRHYDIPAGSAVVTLKRAAHQGGLEIVYSAAVVEGIQTQPVAGEFTPREALELMVAHTPLRLFSDPQTGALSIVRSADAPPLPSSQPQPKLKTNAMANKPRTLLAALAGWFAASTAADAQTASAPPREETITLSAFTVTMEKDIGYATSHSVGGSRVNIENSSVPLSVVTLNRQFLNDLAPANVQEAIRYVSGVSTTSAPNVGQLTLRGFNSNGSVHRDGLEDAISAFGSVITDTATIERIEVVKGPVGTLYGRQNVGGLINRISKMPLRKPETSLMVSGDTFGALRGELDTTGPLGKSAGYRVVLVEQKGENMQGAPLDKRVFYASFSRDFEGGHAYVRLLHERDKVSANTNPWFADRDGVPSTFLARDRSLVPLDDIRDFTVNQLDVGIEKTLQIASNVAALRLVSRYNDLDTRNINYPIPTILLLNAAGGSLGNINTTPFSTPGVVGYRLSERQRVQPIAIKAFSVDVDLVYDFKLGPAKNKVLTYGRFARSQNSSSDRQTDSSTVTIANGVYTAVPLPPTVAAYTATRSRDRGYAWAVQDFLRFLDERLVLAAGARYDSFEYEEHQTDLRLGTPTRTQKIEPSNWTYNYGVVGKPLAGVSVFFNHSETFNLPSPLINVTTGQVFKNLYGESDEYGVKLDLWKNKLTATGSVFEIVQNNQVVNAVNQPGVSVQQGVTKARGYELDLVFQPIREVSLIIGYGWMDSVASSNSATLVRNQRVPQGASYKAFGKYSFLSGPLKGFDVGAGYEFINDRAGDAADGFNVAPYHTYDAFAGYRLNSRFRVQLNVQNLTDEIYVQGAVSRQLVHPGNERNFRFSVRYQF